MSEICVAGFVDRSRSGVLFSPNLSWRGVDLREQSQEALAAKSSSKTMPMPQLGGETSFRWRQSGKDDLLAVTVGTGVGGGLLAGELFVVASGVAAEIGHLGAGSWR
ncbi:MAG: ROK family protein [Marmoricola sp.]